MDTSGLICKVRENEGFYVFVPFTDTYLIEKRNITEVGITLEDGRHISPDQRMKIYATMRDISLYTGHMPEEVKEIMKYDFISATGYNDFSLADVDMTTAREFLEHLIDFCLMWDIPTKESLAERSPDIARYIYRCLIHKKSCISQKKAELHHVDAIGMGNDRKDIIQLGMRVLPLTRKEHTLAHTMGNKDFCELHHVFGIKLDLDLCKLYKVKSEGGN